jgi:hypothetical protein
VLSRGIQTDARGAGQVFDRGAQADELELKLIQTQMTQEPILWAEVYARALSASKIVKRAEVWVGARGAWWVGEAWASADTRGAAQVFFFVPSP